MTLSEAFVVPGAAAVPAAAPITLEKRARVGPRARAQGPILHRVTAAFDRFGGDVAASWWLPSSIPTVKTAWRERIPDRDSVPGNSELLFRGWVVWNHTVGLLVPLLAAAVAGLLAAPVFVVRHPARLALAVVLVAPVVAAVAAAN